MFLTLVNIVFGRFNVEKSSITILNPLVMRSKHDAATANFGVPNYGGYMIGTSSTPVKELLDATLLAKLSNPSSLVLPS